MVLGPNLQLCENSGLSAEAYSHLEHYLGVLLPLREGQSLQVPQTEAQSTPNFSKPKKVWIEFACRDLKDTFGLLAAIPRFGSVTLKMSAAITKGLCKVEAGF